MHKYLIEQNLTATAHRPVRNCSNKRLSGVEKTIRRYITLLHLHFAGMEIQIMLNCSFCIFHLSQPLITGPSHNYVFRQPHPLFLLHYPVFCNDCIMYTYTECDINYANIRARAYLWNPPKMATINYADPPEDLKCLICLEVARDPMQHEACGKLFCKECIERNGMENPCPNCRISEPKFFMDNRSKHAGKLN